MKRLTVSAIALALGMGSALAADLPYRKAPLVVPPPPPPLTWNGFYGGLNIGGGWEDNNNNNQWNAYFDPNYPFGGTALLPGAVPFAPNLFFLPSNQWGSNNGGGGVVGGGQVGYNFQFNPSIVVGVETDFQGTSFGGNNNNNWNTTFYPSPFINPGTGVLNDILIPIWGNNGWNRRGISYIGTVRGRFGWLFTPSLLVYATGGFAYGGSSNVDPGWTVGGGLEWMFAQNWSAKLEYLHAELDRNNNNWGGGFGWNWGNSGNRQQINIVRVGVNYHFNWAQPVPVLAKY